MTLWFMWVNLFVTTAVGIDERLTVIGAQNSNMAFDLMVEQPVMETKQRARTSNDSFVMARKAEWVQKAKRNAASGATLNPNSFRYMDSFNDPVVFAYYGGYVSIECDVKSTADRVECSGEKLYLISPTGKLLSPTNCGQRPVEMRLIINEHTEFGEYRCQFKNQRSEQSFRFNYRFCGDTENVCMSDQTSFCTDDFSSACLVTSTGVTRCAELSDPAVFDPKWCLPEPNVRYCPGNYSSLCRYETKERRRDKRRNVPTLRLASSDKCKDELESPGYTGGGIDSFDHRYGTTMMLLHNQNNGIFCGRGYKQVVCRITDQNGTLIDTITNTECPMDITQYQKNPVAKPSYRGLERWKMVCTFHENAKFIGEMRNYFISFDLPAEPKVTAVSTSEEVYVGTLHCELGIKVEPPAMWQCGWYEWRREERPVENTSTFVVKYKGTYMCICYVTYTICAPNKRFRARYVSKEYYTEPAHSHAPIEKFRADYGIIVVLFASLR